jgi:hypothetical protein
MLTAEHEAAEVLRHMRLKAHAAHRSGHFSFRWLFELLGWRASDGNRAAVQGRID